VLDNVALVVIIVGLAVLVDGLKSVEFGIKEAKVAVAVIEVPSVNMIDGLDNKSVGLFKP